MITPRRTRHRHKPGNLKAATLSVALTAALTLAACSGKAPDAAPGDSATPHPAAASASHPPAPPAPPARAAAARAVHISNDLFAFDYAYPAAAAAIPALKVRLDADLDREQAGLSGEARQGRKDAAANGWPYTPWSRSTEWQVVADLPDWLSLSATLEEYAGGAHPNHGFDALLWDRRAGKARQAVELFTSPRALNDAVRKDFCAELDRQRLKKRGPEAMDGALAEFNACIAPLDQTVILGATGKAAGGHAGFDRIGFLIAPYNAGPYVEGAYEVTLPITPALLRAVRPEYRAAFAAP